MTHIYLSDNFHIFLNSEVILYAKQSEITQVFLYHTNLCLGLEHAMQRIQRRCIYIAAWRNIVTILSLKVTAVILLLLNLSIFGKTHLNLSLSIRDCFSEPKNAEMF